MHQTQHNIYFILKDNKVVRKITLTPALSSGASLPTRTFTGVVSDSYVRGAVALAAIREQ